MVILDLQKAIDHPDWGSRHNPDAEDRVARILAVWRRKGWPVIHVRHRSSSPGSHYAPNQIGYDFKPEVEPIDGETIVTKSVHSAFIENGLREAMTRAGTKSLILAGVKTNNSIEATVRHGHNLGYDIYLLGDACFTHDQIDWNGKTWRAEDVHALTLSNLNEEFCTVTTVDAVLAALPE
ncbi:MAG: cysteine hydrolase family protein [Litorimonas sp.]